MKKVYRYQLYYYLKPDELNLDESVFAVDYQLIEIEVIKETSGSYLIRDLKGKERRIMKGAINSYAHDTKEAAMSCFYHRSLRHAGKMKNKASLIFEMLKDVKSLITNQ
jgi:hypothetical protein